MPPERCWKGDGFECCTKYVNVKNQFMPAPKRVIKAFCRRTK